MGSTQLELTTFIEPRDEIRTKTATSGDSIQTITKNYFRVKSQSGNGWYNVKKLADADVWICDCKNFLPRLFKNEDKRCKHIIDCQTLQNLETEIKIEKIDTPLDTESKIEKIVRPKICPRCLSTTIIKIGFRTLKRGTRRRRFKCKQCKLKFILAEYGFGKLSQDPKIVSLALDLRFLGNGNSYRSIARHISAIYNIKISNVTILNWVRRCIRMWKGYLDNKIPDACKIWSVDEMTVNVKNTEPVKGKGFIVWMWNIIDPDTRFVIASEITKTRESSDARKVFASGKDKTHSSPDFVITDALNSYEEAFRKEFNIRKTAHIKTRSLKDGFQNRPVERVNNEYREQLKSTRGLGNDESAQEWADGKRYVHNFCRPHSGLPGNKTPAEAAGLDLGLGENKIYDLMVKSTTPHNFATQLGVRIKSVTIVNEKEWINVKPKVWIKKKTWREINDILWLNGFSWLSNGEYSCWIKLLDEIPKVDSSKA